MNNSQQQTGIAEYLRYSHMVTPEVMQLKDGGFIAGYWLQGPDLESSTYAELEYLSEMIARAFTVQLDTRWHVHFEYFRRETHEYPENCFSQTTTRLIDMERSRQFEQEGSHYESQQAMFITYVPPSFEQSSIFRQTAKVLLGTEHEAQEDIFEKQLQRFEDTVQALGDSFSLVMKIKRMTYIADPANPLGGNVELLQAINACTNNRWHPIRVPSMPAYLDCLFARDTFNGKDLTYDHEYIKCISLANYPAGTFPGLLLDIQQMATSFRWSNRFIMTDQRESTGKIDTARRQWVQKIRSFVSQATGVKSDKVNQDAVSMVADLDNAMQTANEGEIGFGSHTSTVVLRNRNLEALENEVREVVKLFERNGCNARIEGMNAMEAFLGSLPGHGQENVRKPLITALNYADLVPLSHDWAGEKNNPCPFYAPGSPPLLQAATVGATPFRMNIHVGDVGHTLILGPTGAGKSTLLALMAAQFERYAGSQIFFFDTGRSIYPLARSLRNAVFYDLGHKTNEVSLCPLAEIDQPDVLRWAAEWIETLIELVDPGLVTPSRRILILTALKNLAASTSEAKQRTLTEYITSLQDEKMKAALGFYGLNQSGGYLLDGDHDGLTYSAFSVFEIASLMERGDKITPAVLSYLFFQIQRRLTGQPTIIVIDEAWTALKNKIFAEKIRSWLKTFRKLNCAVVLATQSLVDVLKSDIRDAVLESCPTKILLANPDARNPAVGELYRDFLQLNDRQITLVARMVRKREYYIISPVGRRVFSLGLGPVSMSFVGASGPDDLKRVEALAEEYGHEWPSYWLRERAEKIHPGLSKWADKWLDLDAERAENERDNADEIREIRLRAVDAPEAIGTL